MIYETEFSEEQILSIINTNTKPMSISSITTGNILISKCKKDKIYLLKTGKYGRNRGQLPLVIRLNNNDSYVLLKCSFSYPLAFIIFLTIFVSIAWIGALLICFFNPNYDLSGKLLVGIIVLIWTICCFLMYPIANKLFFRRQQNDVLQFLEQKLHSRRVS